MLDLQGFVLEQVSVLSNLSGHEHNPDKACKTVD